MQTLKIFLASSCELKHDREQFELFLNRRNKAWQGKQVFLELVLWEDFIDAVSKTRLQDEYNRAIRSCDLFVMLFDSKVGKYTDEEFATAYQSFQDTGKPLIYTYNKESLPGSNVTDPQHRASLNAFQAKLQQLGHFPALFKNTEDLLLKFGQQLDKLADSGYIKLSGDSRSKNPLPAISQTHHGSGDNVAGNQTKIGRQINLGADSTYNENNAKE